MQSNAAPKSNSYLNAILTANAVILGIVALNSVTGSHGLERTAQAQAGMGEESTSGLLSAAEQRKQMIAELRGISQRMEKLEGQLAKGVKITSMPPIPGLEDAIRGSKGETTTKEKAPAPSATSTIRPSGATAR